MPELLETYRTPLIATLTIAGMLAIAGCEDNQDKAQSDGVSSASAPAAPTSPVKPSFPGVNKYTTTCNAPNYANWITIAGNEDMISIIEKDFSVSYKTARSARSGEAMCDRTVAATDILQGTVSVIIKHAEKGARCTAVGLMPVDQLPARANKGIIAACLPPPVKAA